MGRKLSAPQSARRREQPKYCYAIFLNGNHAKYLSAQGKVMAEKQFREYLQSKDKTEADGYELRKL
ncbi:MAG: hypothetical protein MUC48_05065 [Leptolyngbya sp. Prado105]|jgi:hypothetical protein|nr:hypothetical protein [Leptolyngbya sp. Prado105]